MKNQKRSNEERPKDKEWAIVSQVMIVKMNLRN